MTPADRSLEREAATAPADASLRSAGRPLRRDAQRNRTRILQAAREVFAARGLSASLLDVSRVAGVGVGTVYRRFPEKGELVDALFEERVVDVAIVLREGLADPDPWSGFARSLERVIEMLATDRGLLDLLLSGVGDSDRLARARCQLMPLGERLVARAQDAGALRVDIVACDAMLIQLMIGTVAGATRDADPEVWRRLLALVLDGLRRDRHSLGEMSVPPLLERGPLGDPCGTRHNTHPPTR